MLKHENPNIEVINKNLWAVRFSLIPFIPQISYKPDPSVPLEQVPGPSTLMEWMPSILATPLMVSMPTPGTRRGTPPL